ncbi:MAG: hypothetical protein NXI09_05600 [Bacteroidetes bacterium]|nr:hypothetical protein [Bacteroidota bacterium]
MRLFDIFKRKRKEYKPQFAGRVLQTELDDFLIVELVPRENITELAKDAKAIQNISENHSGKYGSFKVHVIEKKDVETVDRNIPINEVFKILNDSGLEKFDTVTTWSSSIQEDSKFSTAYGVRSGAIIVERIRDVANHIWFDLHPTWLKDEVRTQLEPVIHRVCLNWNLVLVDRRLNVIVDASDKTALNEYLYQEDDEE